MSAKGPLEISSPQVESGATDSLKIEVALVDPPGTAEDARHPIQIELVLDREVITDNLLRAAEDAADQATGRIDVSDLVTLDGTDNWRPWARPVGDKPGSFTLWISNDRDEKQKQVDQAQRGTAPLSIEIPLRGDLKESSFTEVRHRYATAYKSERRRIFGFGAESDLELWVRANNEAQPAKRPAVRLFAPTEAPHARSLGDTLDIEWEVRDFVSGKLTGPFAGETRVIDLAAVDGQPSLAKGKIKVMALGTQIYELEATVSLDEGKNTVVRRRLIVDVVTDDDYVALRLVPSVVLPRGWIEASWYVSGVSKARIETGKKAFTVLDENNLVDHRQGIQPFYAKEKGKTVTVQLVAEREGGNRPYETSHTYTVRRWADIHDVELQESTPGRQDLAYAQRDGQGILALCLGKCLRYQKVGIADTIDEIDWSSLDEAQHETLACTGFSGGLAVILRSLDRSFRLATYFPGHPLGLSTPLPDFLASCVLADRPVQVCVLNGRGYVIVRTKRSGFAWSFPIVEPTSGSAEVFEMKGEWCEEPLLTAMAAYTLCVCDEALHALDRETGHLYRLAPGEDPRGGTLMAPRVCAPAVDDEGASLVKTGACVAIERLLAVVGSKNEQDIVYNPEWNVWNRCGRDQEGALAVAFRPGASLRLWALHHDSESREKLLLKTLSVGSTSLFNPHYQDNASTPPTKIWLEESSSFSIINNSGETLELPEPNLVGAGDVGMELDGGVGVLAPKPLAPGSETKLEFHHAEGHGPRGDLRYVMSDSGLVLHVHLQPAATPGQFAFETSVSYITRKPDGAIDGLVPLPALRTNSTGTSLELGVVGYFAVVMRNDTRYRLVLEPNVHEPGGRTVPPGESMRVVVSALSGTPDDEPEHQFRIHFEDDKGAKIGTYRLSPSYSENLVRPVQEQLDDPMVRYRSGQVVSADDPRAAELGLMGRSGQLLEFGQSPELEPEFRALPDSWPGPLGCYVGWRTRNCNRVRVQVKTHLEPSRPGREEVHRDESPNTYSWEESTGRRQDDGNPYFSLPGASLGVGAAVMLTPEFEWGDETYQGPTRAIQLKETLQLDGKPFRSDATIHYSAAPSDRTPLVLPEVNHVHESNFSSINLGWSSNDCDRVLVEIDAQGLTPMARSEFSGRTRHLQGMSRFHYKLKVGSPGDSVSFKREFPPEVRSDLGLIALIALHAPSNSRHSLTLRVTPLKVGRERGIKGITQEFEIQGPPSSVVPPVKKTGCCGYWPFDETDGTTAADRSGHDKNAVLHGSMEPVGPTPRSRRRGRRFDGRTAYAQIPHDGRFDFDTNDDFSVAVRVEPEEGSGSIVEKWSGPGGYPYVIRNRNGVVVVARYDGTAHPTITSSRSLRDGNFHHVVFTKQGKTLSLYVDGELDGQLDDTTTKSTRNDSPLFVARRGGVENEYFKGAVADLRIYDYALSPEAVRGVHALCGYWPFPGKASAHHPGSYLDFSGRGNDAKLVGVRCLDDPKTHPNGMVFNGAASAAIADTNDCFNFGTDEDFSVATWIRPDKGQSKQESVIEKWSGSGGFPFVVRYADGSVIAARYDGKANPRLESKRKINDYAFHHVAFVKHGKTLSLYIDGNLDGETRDTTVGDTRNSSPLFLGRRGDPKNAEHFRGVLAELRIHDRALSAIEVAELATQTP